MKCYPNFQDSKIGLSYGAQHQMPGVDINTYTLRHRLNLASNIELRVGKSNNRYFDTKFTKHFLLNYGNVEFPITAGYKRIFYNSNNKIEQFYFGTGIFSWGNGLLIGYTRGSFNSPDRRQRANNGVLIQLYKELFYNLNVTSTMVYWFDEFQYSLKVTDNIYQSEIFAGVALEKVADWNEVSVSLLFLM